METTNDTFGFGVVLYEKRGLRDSQCTSWAVKLEEGRTHGASGMHRHVRLSLAPHLHPLHEKNPLLHDRLPFPSVCRVSKALFGLNRVCLVVVGSSTVSTTALTCALSKVEVKTFFGMWCKHGQILESEGGPYVGTSSFEFKFSSLSLSFLLQPFIKKQPVGATGV